MPLTGDQVDLSNNIQGIANLIISLIWLGIYLYSFKCCCWRIRSDSSDFDIRMRVTSSSHTPTHDPIEPMEPIDKTTTDLQTDEEVNIIKNLTILYPSIYLFRYIIYALAWYIEEKYVESYFKDYILERVMDGCFVIGHIIFYLCIILRFKNGVKFSDYIYIIKLEKSVLYICYILLIIIFFMDSIYFITRDISKEYPDRIDRDIPSHLFWIISVFNLFLGGILIGCFAHKIWIFVKLKATLSGHSKEEIVLSVQQRQFLGIAIKYGLLCGIAITFTNIQFCGWLLLNFELITSLQDIFWFDVFWNWLFDVVLFINFYTMWLTFPFSAAHYTKVCGCCHSLCKTICTYLVISKIDKVTTSDKVEMTNI